MPVPLSFMEKIGINYLNEGPAPMVDILHMMVFKAVHTAIKLGLFELLDTSPLDSKEIAKILPADGRGLELLLGTLKESGYVKIVRSKYVNTKITKKWLLEDSPHSLSGIVKYFNDLIKRWDQLDRSIKTGTPCAPPEKWLNSDEVWSSYHDGMKSIANLMSKQVITHVKIPSSAKTLLDLGGSHGLYCAKFLQQYPQLTGYVVDSQHARDIATNTIQKYKLSTRMRFVAADFEKDALPQRMDIVLVFNVIRAYKPKDAVNLLKKVEALMNKNGIIIVLDQLSEKGPTPLMQLNINIILLELYNILSGHFYTFDTISKALREAGFKIVKGYKLKRSPGVGIAVGTKQS